MVNKGSESYRNIKESEVIKKKERNFVSWIQEEDDRLREQVRLLGTDNWVNIASIFKDKTVRQCRRRWCSYLSSGFKRGDWSPEEDITLCEAQKLYGNRWTEIAKLLAGRTDNAVKNRFNILSRRKEKDESSTKENKNGFVNVNNKRVVDPSRSNDDGWSESAATQKKIRPDISFASGTLGQRPPFGVLNRNLQTGPGNLLVQMQDRNKTGVNFNPAKTINEHSRREVVNLRMSNEGYQPSWRQPDLHMNFSSSSYYTTGSTMSTQPDHVKTETFQADECLVPNQNIEVKLEPTSASIDNGNGNFPAHETLWADEIINSVETDMDFTSPIGLASLFRTFAAEIPSPHFSESEKHFLIKTLGLESTQPDPSAIRSKHPTCKRFLLESLSEAPAPTSQLPVQNDVNKYPSTTL